MQRPTYQGIKRRSAVSIRAVRAQSEAGAIADAAVVNAVERVCFFVGYARSGHTVLASILDAHPDAVIANELDAVGFLDAGFGRAQLLHMMLSNARETAAAGNAWTGYEYSVPDGWQGRVRTARVIGDKKAGVTARRLAADPPLLARLRTEMDVPLRFLHVVRNPYDHVVARARQHPDKSFASMQTALCGLYDSVEIVRSNVHDSEWLDVRAEDLIAAPKQTLRRVLAFLELDTDEALVRTAASIVMTSPSRRRDTREWSAPERESIAARIAQHDFLQGYSFDE